MLRPSQAWSSYREVTPLIILDISFSKYSLIAK